MHVLFEPSIPPGVLKEKDPASFCLLTGLHQKALLAATLL